MSFFPFLIPITALCIPIVAIITGYKLKKAQLQQTYTETAKSSNIVKLEERVAYLEQTIQSMSDDLAKLEDKTRFMERLLDKPAKDQ